jgi:hypothetical protein
MLLFCDIYKVKAGDTLYALGKKRGFDNPGPIVAFPANAALFRTPMSPNQLAINTTLRIPWHPSVLQKLIATSEFLIDDTADFTKELLEKEKKSHEDLEDFLFKIDAVNMIAQIGVSITSLGVEYVEKGYELTNKEVIKWLLAENRPHLILGDVVPMVADPKEPKKDFKFYMRHAFGPWTPSYWASVWAAASSGDMDVWLYGSSVIEQRNAYKIQAQADRDIAKLKEKIENLKWQLALPCYAYRI